MPCLKRAVSNRCLDLIRRRRETAVADVPERAVHDAGFFARDDAHDFYALVQSLPERQRHAVEYDDQVQATTPGDPITCGHTLAIIDAATGDYAIQAQG